MIWDVSLILSDAPTPSPFMVLYDRYWMTLLESPGHEKKDIACKHEEIRDDLETPTKSDSDRGNYSDIGASKY